MDRTAALRELKAKLGPLDIYLQARGINTGADGKKKFLCLNPAHEDKNPSMQCLGANVYCHSCRATYDIIDLMAMERDITPGELIEWGYKHYGIAIDGKTSSQGKKLPSTGKEEQPAAAIPKKAQEAEKELEDFTAYYEKVHARINETDYAKKRGLTNKTIERFKLGYDENYKTYEEQEDGTTKYNVNWKALIIPSGPNSYIARNTNPDAASKNRLRKPAGAPSIPFNLQALEQATEPIFIVEGQFDALSIIDIGAEAIALGGISSKKLLEALEKTKPAQPLIISLDNDEAGQKAEITLIEALTERGIPYIQADISAGYHDANEAYQQDMVSLVKALQVAHNSIKETQTQGQADEQEAYMKINAAACLEDFFKEVAIKKQPYSTGFPLLDKEINGGLFEGLTIVGAVTSAGKTTITMQMADNMAQAGHDVLIFSLETGRNELIARSISKQTLIECFIKGILGKNALTTRDILNGETGLQPEILEAAIQQYSEYANNLYIFQSLGKIGTKRIREETQRHRDITSKTPIVIIDYLQLIGPNEKRFSTGTKEVMDEAVTDLKCLAVDFKTPVILISSFNRNNYTADANFASFKESGGIEYSADLLLGLQYEGAGNDFNQKKLEELAEANPRKMELKIMKHRNGEWGQRISFDYYAFANFFRETAVKKKHS